MWTMDTLRLDGFMATQVEEVDGKLYIEVSVLDPQVPVCGCDAPDVVKHGTRTVHFRDYPLQRQETYLRFKRQRYRCRNCTAIHLEELKHIDEKRRMTIRFRRQLAEDGTKMKFTMGGSVNGVKESLVRRVFKEEAAYRLQNYTYDLPRVLGMDEKYLNGTPRFVVGDVERRVLLDICMSRKLEDLEEYFKKWHHLDRAKVEVITQDMYWGYKSLNERYFRGATIVVDKFHVLRYADFAVSTVRKAIQKSLTKDDRIEMKNNIKLLQVRPSSLDDEDQVVLKRIFRQHPAIEQAVTIKEWFYDIYRADNRADAEKAYDAWKELLPKRMETAFKPITTFMKNARWRRFVFNYFDHPYTNAYVEAVNGLLDEIGRSGRGYKIETLRAKALLKYGDVRPLTSIVKFDLMSIRDVAEQDRILSTYVGHGLDPSTFERDLREGNFW